MMTRYILALLAGTAIGAHINLFQHPEPRALVREVAQRWISASDYVAREVSENGLPLPGWLGYRQGWREGQEAALRVQLRGNRFERRRGKQTRIEAR